MLLSQALQIVASMVLLSVEFRLFLASWSDLEERQEREREIDNPHSF